jgi:phospholipid/cholesterol/gamma-HCH transport system substrate-binding protein
VPSGGQVSAGGVEIQGIIMSKKNIEVFVGLFVLLGMAGLVFLALKAANLGSFSAGGDSYTVVAKFDNIGGLKVRAPVRSAGVTVGRVTSITLDNFQGVVTLEIGSGFSFPQDSSARILTAGLLGDQYVGLEPGSSDANLANKDVIPSTRTQSAVVLENLIGQFLFNKAADAGTAPAGNGSSP